MGDKRLNIRGHSRVLKLKNLEDVIYGQPLTGIATRASLLLHLFFFIVHFEEQLQIRGCLVLKKWEFRVITSGHGKKYVREAISKEALIVYPARALHVPV